MESEVSFLFKISVTALTNMFLFQYLMMISSLSADVIKYSATYKHFIMIALKYLDQI